MFFVLSGFLIAYLYLPLKIESRTGLRIFLGRRFARIFPLYLLVTIAYYVFVTIRGLHDADISEIFLNLTLLKGFSDQYLFTGIMQAWSLTVEESFYLLSPLIFLLIRRKRIFWLQIPVLFLAGLAAVYLFRTILQLSFFERVEFMWFTTFFGRCTEFYLGIFLAKQALAGKLNQRKGIMRTIGGGLATVICIVLMSFLQQPFNVVHSVNAYPGLVVNNLVLPLAIYTFLKGLLTEKTFLSGLLSSPGFQLLGKSSYALYLVHAGIFADFFLRYSRGNLWIQFLLVQALSIVLYKFFEQPLNAWLKKRFFSDVIINRQLQSEGNPVNSINQRSVV